jgi:hypothetical protein
MKISMKYWKIGAYFGSIALAVGIGMFQATAKEGITIIGNSELPDCEVVLHDPDCYGATGCDDYPYTEVDTTRPNVKTVLAPTITYGPPASQQCYRTDRICTIKGTLTLDTSPCEAQSTGSGD